MTIEQIRKEIIILDWSLNPDGITISYSKKSISETFLLKLNPEESARQLSAIGSIDSWFDAPNAADGFMINYEGNTLSWNVFYKQFSLSQYESITLAIRHEYELSIEKDSNMMDLTNSINRLNQLK